MTRYEHALQRLSQASLPEFVTERRRLAAELRKDDKGAAARLEERRKPTASTWVVNQLYWQARDQFDELLAAAAKLRQGKVGASRDYRAALTALRDSATTLLRDAGLGTADATLRKVAATLSALGAAGGFDPQPPGALEHDLDAPGFEAMSGVVMARDQEDAAGRTARPVAPASRDTDRGSDREDRGRERQRRADEEARARALAAQEAAEEKERQREAAARRAELSRMTKLLELAKHKLAAAEAEVASREEQLAAAQQRAHAAREHADDLERRLRELGQASPADVASKR